MFSRIVSTAKSLIQPARPKKTSPKKAVTGTPKKMVTTRGQGRANAIVLDASDAENTIQANVPTPASTKRKANKISKDDEAGVAETPSTKKRKLPVREKEAVPIIANTKPVVEIPAKKSSPPVEVDSDIEIVEPPTSAKKHKKFGSEEPEDTPFSTAPEIPDTLEEDDDEEESSDDDAPEEVGAQAAKDATLKAQSAAEALEGLRKKQNDRASKAKSKDKKSQGMNQEVVEGNASKETGAQPEEPESTVPGDTLRESDPTAMETLEDEEDLEEEEEEDDDEGDSEDESEVDDEELSVVPTPHSRKTKFVLNTEKTPKDRQIGSTTYRVTKTNSKNLAPKFNPTAKTMKETLLYGRTGKLHGSNRKPIRQGFFKK